MNKKKAQLKMSFGMIFSIILIIAFISLAFYVIKIFLGMGECGKIGTFLNEFQNDIDKAWTSSQTSKEVVYTLPKKIKKICFEDESYRNLYFSPTSASCDFRDNLLKHINIFETLSGQDELCIDTDKGKIKMKIKKSFGENSVIIEEINNT